VNFYTRLCLEAHDEWPPDRARAVEGNGPPTLPPPPGRPYYYDIGTPGLETVYGFHESWHAIATIGVVPSEDPG
jgi:hypothetical protein